MDTFIDNILRGLITFGTGIFILLGIGILIYLRKFIISLHEWQQSVFGLEQNIAKRKLVSATTGIALLILLMIGEFLLVVVIGPQMPEQHAQRITEFNPLATATATISVEESQIPSSTVTAGVMEETLESNCVEDVLEITSPGDGETVSGIVEIVGTVNVEDFGYYKYEYSTIGTINWITIAAEDQLKLDELLGNWNTFDLTPGSYLLQVVPLNSAGESLAPCIIRLEVVNEE